MENKAFLKLLYDYRARAKRKGLTFALVDREFKEITSGNCFYCTVSPAKTERIWNYKTHKDDVYKFNGIDRLDNDIGYCTENCVSCCWRCNKMKADMVLEDFFIQISRIYHTHLDIE